jgi:hypothetical protein
VCAAGADLIVDDINVTNKMNGVVDCNKWFSFYTGMKRSLNIVMSHLLMASKFIMQLVLLFLCELAL